MSVAPTIALDGIVLNDRYSISDIHRPWPKVNVMTEEVEGRDGDVVTGLTLGPRSVSFRLWAFGADHELLMGSFAWLMELLTEEPEHRLSFGDEGGLVRVVTLQSYEPDYDEYAERVSMQLDFTMHDPYRDTVATHDVAIPSGGAATFLVDHRAPRLVLAASHATRDESTGLWGVTFDDVTHLCVELPTSSAVAVSIDCHERHVMVGGVTGMIDLGSDWPKLGRGTHVVRMTQGTGAATLTIRKRCL